MEPGLRDREYHPNCDCIAVPTTSLQWSPVLETGNTALEYALMYLLSVAAMEPGLRDREYEPPGVRSYTTVQLQWSPVLETGNTREGRGGSQKGTKSCNGARS